MKIKKVCALAVALLAAIAADAATMTVTMRDGTEREVAYSKRAVNKSGVRPPSGDVIRYDRISAIATADFDAYERVVKMASRKSAEHVTVKYTGEGDVNVLRLQKLERQRQGAGAARGAGGFLMLLGALSGDRDVYAAGLTTYGVGTIVKDINTDKTVATQTEAIRNLQAEQAKGKKLKKADSLEEQYRIEYGDENVDGLIALIEGNHERALAFAGLGATSDDANYRWAAVWLKAVIYADRGDREALEREYERLIVLDPEISDREDAEGWTERLLQDLEKMREE